MQMVCLVDWTIEWMERGEVTLHALERQVNQMHVQPIAATVVCPSADPCHAVGAGREGLLMPMGRILQQEVSQLVN